MNNVCKHYVGSVHVGEYSSLSESGLFVFSELYPVGFLVVSWRKSVGFVVLFCRPTPLAVASGGGTSIFHLWLSSQLLCPSECGMFVNYFGNLCFRSELGFLNCDDICLCVVNKQFELL